MTPVPAIWVVLDIAALLFVYLLVLAKLYNRAQGNSQFRRRLLGISLALLALAYLGTKC